MALGMNYGRQKLEGGLEALMPTFDIGAKLVDRFKQEYGTTNCCELVGRDLSKAEEVEAFLAAPDEMEKCFQRCKKTAGWVTEIISELG